MKKWLHVLTPIAGLVLTALSPMLKASIAAHPLATAIVAAVSTVTAALMPSPVAENGK